MPETVVDRDVLHALELGVDDSNCTTCIASSQRALSAATVHESGVVANTYTQNNLDTGGHIVYDSHVENLAERRV